MDFVFLQEIIVIIGGLILSGYLFYLTYKTQNKIGKIILFLFSIIYLGCILFLLFHFSIGTKKIVCDKLKYYGKLVHSIYYKYSCLSGYDKIFDSPWLLNENCKYKFEIDNFGVVHKILQIRCY